MLVFDSLLPMLLDERKQPPTDQSSYIAEPKLDGYRVLGEFGNGRCRLRTRNGADCTLWFPEVVESLAGLMCDTTIVDGEICVLDSIGRSDFDALHARARRRRYAAAGPSVTFCMFDLLSRSAEDVTMLPLLRRKKYLAGVLAPGPQHILYVQHISAADFPNPISWLYARALELELEGVVGKLANSQYKLGERTPDWFKLKRPGAVPPQRFIRKSR